jgi:hypothetical protein
VLAASEPDAFNSTFCCAFKAPTSSKVTPSAHSSMRENFRPKLSLADELNMGLFIVVPGSCIGESIGVEGLYVAGLFIRRTGP